MRKFLLVIALGFVKLVAVAQMHVECMYFEKLDSLFISHNIHFADLSNRILMDKYLHKNYKFNTKDYEKELAKSYNEFLLWDNYTHELVPDTTKIYMTLTDYNKSRIGMSEFAYDLNDDLIRKSIDIDIMQIFHIDINTDEYECFEILECIFTDHVHNYKLLTTMVYYKDRSGWDVYCTDDQMKSN